MESSLHQQDATTTTTTTTMMDNNSHHDYNTATTSHLHQLFLENSNSNDLFNLDTTNHTGNTYEDDLMLRSPSLNPTASLVLTPEWHQQPSFYFNANHPKTVTSNVSTIAGTGTGSVRIQNAARSERGIAGFVSKLYQCLQSNDANQKYARWCKHDGKDMFIIDNIPEFTEFVLPRLFKHCKFPSFVRQLNVS
ncbi:hypothetical protein BDF20DRAFT_571116 [Mycotypha africana]|uniref:uncharacterized protein n=1 Tax=Mycotypha africana TaxID=64632 RepID=UPI002300E051|nr:uncharacterized protein BDF20DRAFT_571116 [Mycotypha africana]KAI8977487.1 hypothetical protein BDF20DRAFT_571116 [Mycotypha africana]